MTELNYLAGMAPKYSGRIKFFIHSQGYGFIKCDDVTVGDIFIHRSAILDDQFKKLKVGNPVKFDIVKTNKGQKAVNVKFD